MKKLLIIAALLLFSMSRQAIYAEPTNYFVACVDDPSVHGPGDYAICELDEWENVTGGTTYNLNCEGNGDVECCWGVGDALGITYTSFTQNYINQTVSAEIAEGVTSGQIYVNGSFGNYTIQTISQDQSGLACFLWEMGYDSNNNPTLTILESDGISKN